MDDICNIKRWELQADLASILSATATRFCPSESDPHILWKLFYDFTYRLFIVDCIGNRWWSCFKSKNKKPIFWIKTVGASGLARYQPLATKWRISSSRLVEGLLIDTVSDHQSLRLEFRVIRCGPHRSEFGRINNMHILALTPGPIPQPTFTLPLCPLQDLISALGR